MPEGPEIKIVAKTVRTPLLGCRFGSLWLSGQKLRESCDEALLSALKGHTVQEVESYGKMLFISCDEMGLCVQLGMTGSLTVVGKDEPVKPHTHVRFELLDTPYELRYHDIRRFGAFYVYNQTRKHEILKKLGPDPFSWDERIFPSLMERFKRSTRAIKEVLLDQTMIAGIGNIYASESLFVARIHPRTSAASIDENTYKKLFIAVGQVMRQAFENGGTTFSNFVDGHGKKGMNLSALQVFQLDGTPCTLCGHSIERLRQGGRSTFFCPHCQAEKRHASLKSSAKKACAI